MILAGALLLAMAAAAAPPGDDSSPGSIRFVRAADSRFDRYTRAPSPAAQQWMRGHFWRMRCYAPYFDSRLQWYPHAWVYKNLYGIPVDSALVTERPDWLLRDAGGMPLYVRYDCSGTGCPQYAADVGDAGFRAHWIAEARALLGRGYGGLFVDDVNMLMSRVSDGAGRAVAPRDPRTGTAMTEPDWQRYVAEFTEHIRAAFPTAEIVHNALWFAGHDGEFVARALTAADFQNLERGVNDDGIVGGGGEYGFDTFLSHIDWLHQRGKGVIFDADARSANDREYALAVYFLVSTNRDGLGNDVGGTPKDWWPMYDVTLGAPLSGRYRWRDVLRRDFENGIVLVNAPGARPMTLSLERGYAGDDGARRRRVTLGPAEGAVLRDRRVGRLRTDALRDPALDSPPIRDVRP